jgi:threonine synthase
LLVRYDLEQARERLTREALDTRPLDMWRCREVLPVRRTEDVVSLGESATPIVRLARTGERFGASQLLVKDEGRLPTGSFKARGIAMAVSMAKAFGIKRSPCQPTAMPELRLPHMEPEQE